MRISAKGFRLYLNTLSADDAHAIKEAADDEEIAMNSPAMPYPYEMQYVLSFLERAMQKYIAKEEFHFGIYLLDGEIIGLCALASVDMTNKKAELGYWVAKTHWGRGYGKEALKLILRFAFRDLGLNRIYARVLTANERSIRLLTSLNFQNEGTNRDDVFHLGVFMDDFIFGLLKSEYRDNTDIDVVDYQ